MRKTCTKCKNEKELSEFPKCKRNNDGYNSKCKTCCNLINREYRYNNSIKFSKMRKKYYQKNVNKLREEKKAYYKHHKKEKSTYDKTYRSLNCNKIANYKKEWEKLNKDNPIFKIKRNLRRRVNHALHNNKKADKTFELIGCTPEFFKLYIESLFLENMSWNNYGEWHIDHKKPCYTFDLSDENQQRECFHYTNQRPLWAVDNLSRSRNN